MKNVLLDNGAPRSAAALLCSNEISALHVGDLGLSRATDQAILDYAAVHQLIVVTLDADFHTLLALSYASAPSVIRIRIEGLKAPEFAIVVREVLQKFDTELSAGAVLSVSRRVARCHLLPLGQGKH